MNLIEPGHTPWDLRFYIADIPVRVHPLFWLMSLLVVGLGDTTGLALILGVVVVFISILVHELGHAFVMRYYGERARVVLYLMGGLAISGGDVWDLGYQQRARSPQQQIIISFAGPLAGFLLAAITAAIVYLAGGEIRFGWFIFIPVFGVYFPHGIEPSAAAMFTLDILLYVNIYWGLLNLLPVYPLDGGQIARQVFILQDRYEGLTRSLWLSLIVGAGMTLFALAQRQFWMAILFGSLAFGSWQTLQNSGYGGRRW